MNGLDALRAIGDEQGSRPMAASALALRVVDLADKLADAFARNEVGQNPTVDELHLALGRKRDYVLWRYGRPAADTGRLSEWKLRIEGEYISAANDLSDILGLDADAV